ncbi:MAG: NUDIX hydrolase [Vulcanimicrobiaceae bacterium]
MRTVESDTVFRGKVFSVRRDVVESEGRQRVVEVVEHALSYAVVAQPTPGEIVLVHQYRHAAGEKLWEIPAGAADGNEAPREGALRELREETGYRGGRIRELFRLYPTPGFCDEQFVFFLVEELASGETQFDEDEAIETRCMPVSEALALFQRGDIKDAKTIIALLWLDQVSRQKIW